MSTPRSLPLNCLMTSLAGPQLVTPSSRRYLQKFILDDGFDVSREREWSRARDSDPGLNG